MDPVGSAIVGKELYKLEKSLLYMSHKDDSKYQNYFLFYLIAVLR